MPFYQQLKLLLSIYILQPVKFEVHDKQYYIVNKVEKGAAGKNFTIFIVKTEVLKTFSGAGENFFRRDQNFNFYIYLRETLPLK